MNQDGVSAALELIFEEISSVHRQMTDEITAAFGEERHEEAGRINESAKRLLAFRSQLQQLRKDWGSGVDVATRGRVTVPSYSIPPHSKGRKTALRVRMPSGNVICRNTAAQTLVDVLQEFGLGTVADLQIPINKEFLVSRTPSSKYKQHRSGPYFVMTASSTASKKNQLEQIATRLGKTIMVEIL